MYKSTIIVPYRWIVFLAALGYWLYLFTSTSFDTFGWQFRFLTVWCLTANVFVAFLMLRISLTHGEKTEKKWDALVSATVIFNMVVVFLYWKLLFEDPRNLSAYSDAAWYMEYYLHGLGPALMWIDAFFILGAFRKVISTIWDMMLYFFGYTVWIELFVAKFNDYPVGSETNGLPYPFLNNMTDNARMTFYATTLIIAMILFLICLVIVRAWRTRRGAGRL